MTPEQALERLEERRRDIDRIDRGILDLLNERARVVGDIGAIKRDMTMPIYEPKREEAVFKNLFAHNSGPLSPPAIRRMFERVIDEMRTLQKELMEKKS
jgi:chorismate mutase